MLLARRELLLGSLALPSLRAQKKAPAAAPNILLIVADDLAAWMLGCYGNKEIRTPNIDQLAQAGTRFANSFVCTPICSASRATLFTGRLPSQHGIHDFLTARPIENPPQGQAAPPPSFQKETMISDVLSAQGYNCGYVGKWHMGNDATPQHHCNFWYTMAGPGRYQNPTMSWNGKVVEETGYLTDLMTGKAKEFLDQQKPDKPFFLTVGYFNPHLPYDGHPSKYYEMYSESTFESMGREPVAPNALREKEMMNDVVGNLRKCAAATTALDDQIPLLLGKLHERGLRENTLIVFCGDNGFLLGRHGLWSKGLASDPINMYEEAIKVPMIWNWPGRTPVQIVRNELISFYDAMPTLCEVTGAPAPAGLFGRSYSPLGLGRPLPEKQPWRNLVFGQYRNTEMVRDSRYKLVLRNRGQGPNELFDLNVDAREKVNRYNNPAYISIREQLTRQIAALAKAG